jgi:hypothetical protein
VSKEPAVPERYLRLILRGLDRAIRDLKVIDNAPNAADPLCPGNGLGLVSGGGQGAGQRYDAVLSFDLDS